MPVTPILSGRSFAISFLEHDWRSIFDQVGDSCGIPVRHPHAPVRGRMADLPRFGRAVDAVVRYVDPHPDHTDRIVWTCGDLHLGICLIGIPEQVGVVVVGWISYHISDHPIPERERIVLTAAGHWGVKDNLAFPVIHPQDRCFLRDNDLDRPSPGPASLVQPPTR